MKKRDNKLDLKFNKNTKNSNEVYIIAEVGINHNGDLEVAKQLMKHAVDSGANAVKFQKRDLKSIYVPDLIRDSNSAEWSFQYLLPQLKRFELTKKEYVEINQYAKKLNIDLIITPFDLISVEFIKNLDLVAVKIASADLTNWPLIKKSLALNLPIILSIGMWGNKEILETANFVKSQTKKFVLLHCQSTYPAAYESINLKYLEKLKRIAPIIGYSGHERGISTSIAAVALGARVIEKHITLDKSQSGPDHRASLNPEEFRNLVTEIRKVEKALGIDNKIVSGGEVLNREIFAKSLTAKVDLNKGYSLSEKDLLFMAPGKGIPPSQLDQWVGKKLVRDKKKYEYLSERDFHTSFDTSDWEQFKFNKKWGVKCRFHDFKDYKELNSPVVEFHCSDKDIYSNFLDGNINSELIVHAPEIMGTELFDLCSIHEDIGERSIEMLNKTIKKTLELNSKFKPGKPKIVVHMGGMSANTQEYDTRKMMKLARERLGSINTKDVMLLPENLPPRPWYLGGQWFQHAFMDPKEIRDFCESLGFDITLDLSHAQLYCNYFDVDMLDYVSTLLPLVKHMHISDAAGIDGEGLQIEEGTLNFKKVFQQTVESDFSWVPEIWQGHNDYGAGFHLALKRLSKYDNKI